jgi:hypothetical protein
VLYDIPALRSSATYPDAICEDGDLGERFERKRVWDKENLAAESIDNEYYAL